MEGLLEHGRLDGLMYAALEGDYFDIANWIVENIEAEKIKKLAKTLQDHDENILASSLHSLSTMFTSSGEQKSERYRLLLSFLSENTK